MFDATADGGKVGIAQGNIAGGRFRDPGAVVVCAGSAAGRIRLNARMMGRESHRSHNEYGVGIEAAAQGPFAALARCYP